MNLFRSKIFVVFHNAMRSVQKNEEEGLILADFGRRKKKIKEVCEKYGAFTTR